MVNDKILWAWKCYSENNTDWVHEFFYKWITIKYRFRWNTYDENVNEETNYYNNFSDFIENKHKRNTKSLDYIKTKKISKIQKLLWIVWIVDIEKYNYINDILDIELKEIDCIDYDQKWYILLYEIIHHNNKFTKLSIYYNLNKEPYDFFIHN